MFSEEDKNKPEEVVEDTESSASKESAEEVVEEISKEAEEVEAVEEATAVETTAEVADEEASSDPEDSNVADVPFAVGRKVGMTRIFDESGRDYPTTVIEIDSCVITQLKNTDNDGYIAVQVGFGSVDDKKLNKATKGHLAKSKSSVKYFKEFRCEDLPEVKLGDKIDARIFELGDFVTVSGTSKGRGFAGHMKRHGFGGGRRSHGKNSVMRKAGSIGAGSDPSRVWLGTRMAGRFGNDRVSVKNLEVIRVDIESNLVFLRGAVPGSKNGIIYLTK